MMHKTMLAKYPGKCAISGARINPGDDIVYDTVSRKAWLNEPGDCKVRTMPDHGRYISDVYRFSSGHIAYRNKAGLCIDAPCCGCCTG
jgi:hypothetical protein